MDPLTGLDTAVPDSTASVPTQSTLNAPDPNAANVSYLAQNHPWMPPATTFGLANAGYNPSTLATVSSALQSAYSTAGQGLNFIYGDPVLQKQPSLLTGIRQYMQNTLGPPPVTADHISQIQTALQQKGFGSELPAGLWTPAWVGAWNQYKQAYAQSTMAGNKPGSKSSGGVLHWLTAVLPKEAGNALIGFAKALPHQIRQAAADSMQFSVGGLVAPHQVAQMAAQIDNAGPKWAGGSGQAVDPEQYLQGVQHIGAGRIFDDISTVLMVYSLASMGSKLATGVGESLAKAPVENAWGKGISFLTGPEAGQAAAKATADAEAAGMTGRAVSQAAANAVKNAAEDMGLQEAYRGPGVIAKTLGRSADYAGKAIGNIPVLGDVGPWVGKLNDADGLYYRMRTMAAIPYEYKPVQIAGQALQTLGTAGAEVRGAAAISGKLGGKDSELANMVQGTHTLDAVDGILHRNASFGFFKPSLDDLAFVLHAPEKAAAAEGSKIVTPSKLVTGQANAALNATDDMLGHVGLAGSFERATGLPIAKLAETSYAAAKESMPELDRAQFDLMFRKWMTSKVDQFAVSDASSRAINAEMQTMQSPPNFGSPDWVKNVARPIQSDIAHNPEKLAQAREVLLTSPDLFTQHLLREIQDSVIKGEPEMTPGLGKYLAASIHFQDNILPYQNSHLISDLTAAQGRTEMDFARMKQSGGVPPDPATQVPGAPPDDWGAGNPHVDPTSGPKPELGLARLDTVTKSDAMNAAKGFQKRLMDLGPSPTVADHNALDHDIRNYLMDTLHVDGKQAPQDTLQMISLINDKADLLASNVWARTDGPMVPVQDAEGRVIRPVEGNPYANIPEDKVRLFRGEKPGGAQGAQPHGENWTARHSFAQQFAGKDGTVYHVDVPADGWPERGNGPAAFTGPFEDGSGIAAAQRAGNEKAITSEYFEGKGTQRGQTEGAPQNLIDSLNKLRDLGYKPVVGQDVHFIHRDVPLLDPFEGPLTYRRKMAGFMGLNTERIAPGTIGMARTTGIRSALQDLVDTGKIQLPAYYNVNTLMADLRDKSLLGNRGSSLTRAVSELMGGVKGEESLVPGIQAANTDLTRANIQRLAHSQALDEANASLGLGMAKRKDIVSILTRTDHLPSNTESQMLWDAEQAGDPQLATQMFSKPQANQIYRAITKGYSQGVGNYQVGLSHLEEMFRGGFGFLGDKIPGDFGEKIANIPKSYVQLRNDMRFALNPELSIRRILKTNLQLAAEDVTPTFRPGAALDKMGTNARAEAYGLLHSIDPSALPGVSDSAEQILQSNDIFGLYNHETYKAYAALSWQRQGLTPDQIAQKLVRVFDYGTYDTGQIGRTAAEKSANFFFFPFSFDKHLYRNMGGYLLDHPGQTMLLDHALAAYKDFSDAHPSSPLSGKWLADHAPILKEAQRLNAFNYGVGFGQFGAFGALNGPVMNMFAPQNWKFASKNEAGQATTALEQFLPALKEAKNLINDGGSQGKIVSTGIGNKWDSIFGTPPTTIGGVQFKNIREYNATTSTQYAAGNAAYLKAQDAFAPYLQWNDTHTGASKYKLPMDPKFGAYMGQVLDKTLLKDIIHKQYPGFDPTLGAVAAAKNQEAVRQYMYALPPDSPSTPLIKNILTGANALSNGLQTGKVDLGTGRTTPITPQVAAAIQDSVRSQAVQVAEQDPGFYKVWEKYFASRFGPLERVA